MSRTTFFNHKRHIISVIMFIFVLFCGKCLASSASNSIGNVTSGGGDVTINQTIVVDSITEKYSVSDLFPEAALPNAFLPATQQTDRFKVYTETGKLFTIDKDFTNIRSQPYRDDYDENVLATAPYQTEYRYYERIVDTYSSKNDVWYRIILPSGDTGYVHQKVVQTFPNR